MSRVRILNLPDRIDEVSLKKHFSSVPISAASKKKGGGRESDVCFDVTDCSIKRNTQGKVRFGFVGYRTTGAAQKAVEYFNNTFIGTQKIAVEIATGLKEAAAAKLAKKEEIEGGMKQGVVPKADEQRQQKRARPGEPEQGTESKAPAVDALKATFMAERNQANVPTWAGAVLQAPGQPAVPQNKEEQDAAENDAEAERRTEEKRRRLEKVSDSDFLASLAPPVEAKETLLPETNEMTGNGTSTDLMKANADAEYSCRVRIGNIPYTATEDEVKNFFSSKFGPILEVHIPVTRDTKQSKGKAFLRFASRETAKKCIEFDGEVFMGRLVTVTGVGEDPFRLIAEERRQKEEEAKLEDGGEHHASSFKKEKKKEKASGDNILAWNAMYVDNSSAVSKVAAEMNVSQQDIVSRDAPGAAVRAAVAEALVTRDAFNLLSEEALDLDLLSGANPLEKKRSNTTILLKNLPAGAILQELTKMFTVFGPIESVVAPPALNFALIVFVHSQDARKAFQSIAYRKYKGSPLYLEWAPIGAVREGFTSPMEADGDEHDKKNREEEMERKTGVDKVHTVYITNLPFGMTEEGLKEFILDTCPRILHQSDKLTKLTVVSDKGRAYVSFSEESMFQYVLSKLQGRSLQGRAITAVPSKPTEEAKKDRLAVPQGANPLKLVVKNLPFEATEADLRELFSSFSEVKAVRVPRRVHKFGSHRENNHRGFGFVEFLTEQEAKNALKSLANTHLYGRHLVLQYATLGDSDRDQ